MVRADGVEDYEDEPYAELTYQLTHPDGFATIGALLGLAPAPVETCRVLELGCASGANIIAMAEALPRASFTGVDLSPRQVAAGRAMTAELGIRNVELLAGDIRDIEMLTPGSFDYVIAHGVYSWVPAEVRGALLANCRRLLAPNGIACISYNAYPGWAPLHALREMMLHHTRNAANPANAQPGRRRSTACSSARTRRPAVRSGNSSPSTKRMSTAATRSAATAPVRSCCTTNWPA